MRCWEIHQTELTSLLKEIKTTVQYKLDINR